MQKVIFGIGPNPIEEDENQILLYCPLVLYVGDKETWDIDKCCSDLLSKEVCTLLGKLGFGSEEDGIFEPDRPRSREEILKMLELMDFVYNKEFEDFMKNSIEE
jgi:hypothetical protein